MNVVITDFVDGAKNAQGIVVIIDVFRAFSVACYCLDNNPDFIAPVGSVDDAFALKQQYPSALLVGEREGKKLAGFDHGNSPTELMQVNVTGKQIIHTTHAGTQGLINANNADIILTGSFLNAQATVNFIKSKNPEVVTLVRMGWKAESNTDEDDLCAEYLASLLLDKPFDENTIITQLRASDCSDRFFDEAQPWNPISDFELCLKPNIFNFAVVAEQSQHGFLQLKKLTLN